MTLQKVMPDSLFIKYFPKQYTNELTVDFLNFNYPEIDFSKYPYFRSYFILKFIFIQYPYKSIYQNSTRVRQVLHLDLIFQTGLFYVFLLP